MKTKNTLRGLKSAVSVSQPETHTLAISPGKSLPKKTSHNKLLRNTIGSALVLAAFDSIDQAQAVPTDFNYTGGIVTWVVPTTGLYEISAFGAQGGGFGPNFFGVSTSGYFGAQVAGGFSLTSGQVLSIAVGGAGANGGPGYPFGSGNGGGGGGSFVWTGASPLLIAGGGGGAGAYGSAGQTGTSGSAGGSIPFGYANGGAGGSSGSGGGSGGGYTGGGGGGGWVSSGGSNGGGSGPFGFGVVGADGGGGFLSSFAGGTGGTFEYFLGDQQKFGGAGGFGGGGGGGAYSGGGGGGGGGGYSGGGGGFGGFGPVGGGGGGGSFNAGLDQVNVAGFQSGNGLVQIEALSTSPVPDAASTAGLLGLGLAALGVVRRRFAC